MEGHDPAPVRRHPRGAPAERALLPDLTDAPPPPAPPTLALRPRPSLGLAALGVLSGVVFAGLLGGIAFLVTGEARHPATVAAGFVGLWVPLTGAALLASRQFGSGSPRDDLGVAARPVDLGWGALVGVAGIVAASATQVALSPFPRLVGDNTGFIKELRGSPGGVVVIVVATMVGAPIVEELFFRGLVLHSLARLGLLAVLLQALVFGLIHFDPSGGLSNVGVVLGVGAFGLVQGFAARAFGRLGPTIVSHSLFNGVAVVPLLMS